MADSERITSRRHPVIRDVVKVRDDRNSSLIFLEGPRLLQEAVSSPLVIEILVWTSSADHEAVLPSAQARARRKYRVSDDVLQSISDVETPQGILALVRRPAWVWNDLLGKSPAPLLILDGVQDPGNVAAILRTAEASGAAGVVTTEGAAHLFSPKALRGAMGSTLRLPSIEHRPVREICDTLKAGGYRIAAATMRQGEKPSAPYTRLEWRNPWAVVLGREGQGLSPAWEPHAATWIHIPMQSPVKSLNVASTAAILLYESLRQRSSLV